MSQPKTLSAFEKVMLAGVVVAFVAVSSRMAFRGQPPNVYEEAFAEVVRPHVPEGKATFLVIGNTFT